MKMWDIAISIQGGQGLASFVGTMNMIRSIQHIGEQEEKWFLYSEQNNKANTTIIQIQNKTLYQKSISVYYFLKDPMDISYKRAYLILQIERGHKLVLMGNGWTT